MKKLSKLFLSLMLVLGMGTAFAQEGGDEPTTPSETIEAPTFSPAAGAVTEGTQVTISGENDGYPTSYKIAYVIDNADFDFDQYLGKDVPYSIMYTEPIVINTAKTITAAIYKYDVDEEKVLGWSEKVTAAYTLAGVAAPEPPAKPKAPSLSPAANATVAVGSKIEISIFPEPDNYAIYYTLNGSDDDFDLTYAQMKGANNLTLYNDETKVTASSTAGTMTLKAAVVAIDDANQLVSWSNIKTANYTAVERPAAPTFSPDGGEISEGATITLTNGTESAETKLNIYYTKKGDASVFETVKNVNSLNSAQTGISQKLWLYEGALTTDRDTTIHAATAMIIGTGNYATVIWSEPVTKRFTVAGSTGVEPDPETPVAPTFNPDGGEIEATAAITITSACSSCKIYYSEYGDDFVRDYETENALDEAANNNAAIFHEYSNGAKPSLSDMDVETPGSSLSLSAAAVKIAADGTLTWSDVVTKEFTVKASEEPVVDVATPVITPANDAVVRMGAMVTITCATEGAEIYYTTNGSAPYTTNSEGKTVIKEGDTVFKYTEPFALTQDMLERQGTVWSLRIRAVAKKGNVLSTGASVGYVVYPNNPVFSVPAGEVREGKEVAIACIPTQADIYYTTDGSTPTMENSPKYTAPIAITGAMTLKAVAVLGQYQSSVVSAAYTIKTEADPNEVILSFNPASGTEVEEGTAVTITSDKDVDIFYMMFATAAEAYAAAWNQEEAEAYGEETKPVLSIEKPVIKAAYIRKDAEEIDNEFFYAIYTVTEKPVVVVPDTVKVPTFSVAAGEVAKGTKVEIACETEDAVIYYTVDGSEPTAESTEYTAAISIDSAMTIKAIAVKEGMENSKIAEAAYTIKEETANEGLELQGVSIYPNPNGGVFYIELPVDATVEVFATSGMLCQRMNVAAGKTELTIGQSGIYFVRITGEGRSTVKRVIVR